MTTEISFSDWVDWLAFELMFVELYRSASPAEKRKMMETIRRLTNGISKSDRAAFTSQVPNFGRALTQFAAAEQNGFDARFSRAILELASHIVVLYESDRAV